MPPVGKHFRTRREKRTESEQKAYIMKISVCIPMYNESEICREAADRLFRAMEERRGEYDYEVIFCDDGSGDGTAEILREHIADSGYKNLRVIGYENNRGKGAAVREAVLHTDGDCVVYTDCDLAYGTDVIFTAAELTAGGAAFAVGSRNLDPDGYGEYTPLRRAASKIYIKMIALCAGFRLSDSQCGFKAFDGDTARRIFSLCTTDGFSFDLEVIKIAQKMGIKICELPVKVLNHRASKIHLARDAVKMLSDVRKIRKKVKKLNI